jgi:hypothetical protein
MCFLNKGRGHIELAFSQQMHGYGPVDQGWM